MLKPRHSHSTLCYQHLDSSSTGLDTVLLPHITDAETLHFPEAFFFRHPNRCKHSGSHDRSPLKGAAFWRTISSSCANRAARRTESAPHSATSAPRNATVRIAPALGVVRPPAAAPLTQGVCTAPGTSSPRIAGQRSRDVKPRRR